jgi:hypothetical protein
MTGQLVCYHHCIIQLIPSYKDTSFLLCFMSKAGGAASMEGASNDVGVNDSGAYRGTSSRFPAHVFRAWLPIASPVSNG